MRAAAVLLVGGGQLLRSVRYNTYSGAWVKGVSAMPSDDPAATLQHCQSTNEQPLA